ncbi:MAG: UvrD-helicase domain-containing protein [Leptospiraceae bacterium]|nr:UvrD-helicase domain-containing protein [Leptospiraceae bacterium]MDW7974968.1 3'-5' exonuclease [Leptospiraceae bacterium]
MELNQEQWEAVHSIEGPVLVFAGAGSGKTRVIVHRIQNMIEKGIPPQSIVAVTFTNKSAKEMKKRLSQILPKKNLRGMVVSTFHSLGNKILQSEIEIIGYRRPYTIFDQEDKIQILKNIYKELKLNDDGIDDDYILYLISLIKNSNLKIETWLYQNGFLVRNLDEDTFLKIYKKYHEYLLSLNAIDFDDLILLPLRMFSQYPVVLEKYQKRYKYFLVDEFQDTNPLQYAFLRLLVGDRKNVCVVGDDDQSIYGWRGADVSIIQNFKKDYPHAKIIILNKNYRSTQIIIDAAYSLIKNNLNRVDKKIISMNKMGGKIKIIECYDEKEEAEKVAEIILKKITREKRNAGDFAILFRTNYQARPFEVELRKRGIPYQVVGGYRFFDRKEVKDLLAYLRAIANPHDEISLLRIINFPKRGIGESTIKKIHEFIIEYETTNQEKLSFYQALQFMVQNEELFQNLQKQILAIKEFLELLETYRKEFAISRSLSQTLRKLIQELKLEEEYQKEEKEEVAKAKIYNLSEIVNMLAYFEEEWDEVQPPSLFDFLSRVSLLSSDSEVEDIQKGRVQLLTLHLSKGLEFPVVFLCGMNEKIFPSERALLETNDENRSLEEERRLCYVGITRAKEELFLSYSLYRKRFGEEIPFEPSRFLNEIPEEFVEYEYITNKKSASLDKSEIDDVKILLNELNNLLIS